MDISAIGPKELNAGRSFIWICMQLKPVVRSIEDRTFCDSVCHSGVHYIRCPVVGSTGLLGTYVGTSMEALR